MPAGSVWYVCAAADAGIRAFRPALAQDGTNHQVRLETWDEIPAGEAGDCYFRGIDVTIKYDNGYNIGVVPVVDGVELTEQVFTGVGTGVKTLQAFIAKRGTRIAAIVRTIARTGSVDFQNIHAVGVPMRVFP